MYITYPFLWYKFTRHTHTHSPAVCVCCPWSAAPQTLWRGRCLVWPQRAPGSWPARNRRIPTFRLENWPPVLWGVGIFPWYISLYDSVTPYVTLIPPTHESLKDALTTCFQRCGSHLLFSIVNIESVSFPLTSQINIHTRMSSCSDSPQAVCRRVRNAVWRAGLGQSSVCRAWEGAATPASDRSGGTGSVEAGCTAPDTPRGGAAGGEVSSPYTHLLYHVLDWACFYWRWTGLKGLSSGCS